MIKVKMAKSTLSLAWILVLFVGLQCAIRQWGTAILSSNTGYYDITLPIGVSEILKTYPLLTNDSSSLGNYTGIITAHTKGSSSFNIGVYTNSTTTNVIGIDWLAICVA